MKKAITLLSFLLSFSCMLLMAEEQDSISISTALPKSRIYLNDAPLRVDEKIYKDNNSALKEFVKHIDLDRVNELDSVAVLFYNFPEPSHPLAMRLMIYLINDGDAIRLDGLKDNVAILVKQRFDVALFEENMQRMHFPYNKITKEEFLKD